MTNGSTAIQKVETAVAAATPQVAFGDIERMAAYVAKSGLFACKTADQAVTLMLLCQAEGMHPIEAMRTYHLIQGRPTMRSDAMQARFQQRGGKVRWIERTDSAVAAEFSHPDGGTVVVKWTIEMARQAGLAGKDTWKAYPRQMLTARVVSEGVRTVLPGVVAGIYTPEEAGDFDARPPVIPPMPTAEVVDVTPVDPTAKFAEAWDTIADQTWGIDVTIARRFVAPLARKLKVDPKSPDGQAKLLETFQNATAEQVNKLVKLVEAADKAAAEQAKPSEPAGEAEHDAAEPAAA